MVAGESKNFTIVINNTGNALNLIIVSGYEVPSGWESLKRTSQTSPCTAGMWKSN